MKYRKIIIGAVFFLGVIALMSIHRLLFNKPADRLEQTKNISFWHINNDMPSQLAFKALAREFESQNPGLHIEVTMLENMEFKPKLHLELSMGRAPDIFHSWGGGVLVEQVQAGYVKDITEWVRSEAWQSKISDAALSLYTVDGKIYGFPQDLGAIGFWYNVDLLKKAGFNFFPRDWENFLQMCGKLKSEGIIPVALGLADRWPVTYYWNYLALRIAGSDLFKDISAGKRTFTDPALIQAGTMMREFYLKGFLPETAIGDDFPTQSRLVGDGICAMQLMGQWALATQAQSADVKDQLSHLMRFAPFPRVATGAGRLGDVIGGGNGFAVAAAASDEAVAFLEFFMRAENLQKYYDVFPFVPTVAGVNMGNSALNMVKEYVANMDSYTLYPDQMFTLEINTLLNDLSPQIMLGSLDVKEACEILQAAFDRQGEY